MWPDKTAVCTECGHDFRSGKKLRTSYDLRDRNVELGCPFLGTYSLYSIQINRKNQRTLVIKQWFLWIPVYRKLVELKDYDSIFTDWSFQDDGDSRSDLFTLELQGPMRRPNRIWQGQNEQSMHVLIDLLKEAAGLTIKRK
jgi:hypothetical protein